MNAKFIKTNNLNMKDDLNGTEGILRIRSNAISFIHDGYLFTSSLITKVEQDGKSLTIHTANSIYYFELLVEGRFNWKSRNSKAQIMEHFHSLKSSSFSCFTERNNGNKSIATVTFDSPKSRGEVRTLIEQESITQIDNEKVVDVGLATNLREIVLASLPFNKDNKIITSEISNVALRNAMGQETVSEKHFFKKMNKLGFKYLQDDLKCM